MSIFYFSRLFVQFSLDANVCFYFVVAVYRQKPYSYETPIMKMWKKNYLFLAFSFRMLRKLRGHTAYGT